MKIDVKKICASYAMNFSKFYESCVMHFSKFCQIVLNYYTFWCDKLGVFWSDFQLREKMASFVTKVTQNFAGKVQENQVGGLTLNSARNLPDTLAKIIADVKLGIEERLLVNFMPSLSLLLIAFLNSLGDLFDRWEQVIAIASLVYLTTGSKTLMALIVASIFDFVTLHTRRYLGFPEQHPYAITCVDRVWATLALVWNLSEVFMYFPDIVVDNDILAEVHVSYTMGLEYLFGAHEFMIVILSLLVFRQVIRRRGPDTKWYGPVKVYWIKHFVRYYWCCSTGICSVLNIVMFAYYKFFINAGLGYDEQEIFSLAVVYLISLVSLYLFMGIIIGKRARLPLFHGACVAHVGQLKEGIP
jgi:hypothetical protein